MVDQVLATLRALPYLLPGVIIALLVVFALRRWAHAGWALAAWAAWAVLLVVLAIDPAGGAARHACDLSRWIPLSPGRWWDASSDALNVWVFVLLGALGAWTRAPRLMTLLGALLPVAFEFAQTFLPRDCTSYDLVNNLAGLFVGLCLGAGIRLLAVGNRA